MGGYTATGAILIITGWFSLVEFDHFSESERRRILQKIKQSPGFILITALMPAGIFIHAVGAKFGSIWLATAGSTLIFLQGIIVSALFWRRKRWKGIVLLSAVLLLGIFIYIPLFFH